MHRQHANRVSVDLVAWDGGPKKLSANIPETNMQIKPKEEKKNNNLLS